MDSEALARQVIASVWTAQKPVMPRSSERFSHGEYRLMGYLYCRKEPVRAGQLSQVLDISTARVAKLLQTLEEKGAVQRACDPADRRRVQVCLTPCGQEMVHTAHGHMVRQLTRLFDALGEQDAREYVRLCGRVAELTRQLRAAPPEENEVSK